MPMIIRWKNVIVPYGEIDVFLYRSSRSPALTWRKRTCGRERSESKCWQSGPDRRFLPGKVGKAIEVRHGVMVEVDQFDDALGL